MKRTPHPKPENPHWAMFRRYSKPIYALLTAIVLAVLFSLIAQTLLAQQVLVPSESPKLQSAPMNQTSPSPPQLPQEAETQASLPTESPAPAPSSETQATPQPMPNKTLVKTSYTPLPQPAPEAGIAIVSVTYSSTGDNFFQRFLGSVVTNVTVINFGQNYLTATTITMIPNSQSEAISVVIPPNSTVDIATKLIPTNWRGSGTSGTRFYVVVSTAEGYTAASSEFEFPILDY
jgi:cytoskeletal protein RodZ